MCAHVRQGRVPQPHGLFQGSWALSRRMFLPTLCPLPLGGFHVTSRHFLSWAGIKGIRAGCKGGVCTERRQCGGSNEVPFFDFAAQPAGVTIDRWPFSSHRSAYAAAAGIEAHVFMPADVPMPFIVECQVLGDHSLLSLDQTDHHVRLILGVMQEPM